MITLLTTSILTDYGTYSYKLTTLDEVKSLIKYEPFQSAIGHQATAEILTDLLEVPVAMNRIQYVQTETDIAIVFKLKNRIPEGAILTRPQIEEIGYEFGILIKLS